MEGLRALIESYFEVLDIEFTIGEISFTLLDVIWAGAILSIVGLFIGKILLFFNNRR